ncbi:hypothetical protein PENTCL1PPCAC_28744, partial [Pristionchus entomophagus]
FTAKSVSREHPTRIWSRRSHFMPYSQCIIIECARHSPLIATECAYSLPLHDFHFGPLLNWTFHIYASAARPC